MSKDIKYRTRLYHHLWYGNIVYPGMNIFIKSKDILQRELLVVSSPQGKG